MPEFASVHDIMSNCMIRPSMDENAKKPTPTKEEVQTSNVVVSQDLPPPPPERLMLSGRAILNVSNTTWFGILSVLITLNLILSFIIVFRL